MNDQDPIKDTIQVAIALVVAMAMCVFIMCM